MTTRRIILVAALVTALLLGAAAAAAAVNSGYTLNWFSVDGGGGTSTGAGGYTVSGSIGQPDAGTLSGGGYTLQGGFWGGAAANPRLYLPLVQR
jgi:opacity protein-like surface antigen